MKQGWGKFTRKRVVRHWFGVNMDQNEEELPSFFSGSAGVDSLMGELEVRGVFECLSTWARGGDSAQGTLPRACA